MQKLTEINMIFCEKILWKIFHKIVVSWDLNGWEIEYITASINFRWNISQILYLKSESLYRKITLTGYQAFATCSILYFWWLRKLYVVCFTFRQVIIFTWSPPAQPRKGTREHSWVRSSRWTPITNGVWTFTTICMVMGWDR